MPLTDPKIGDIVTRSGSDEQMIVACWPASGEEVLQITVRVVKTSRKCQWFKLGDEETNLPGRYLLVRRPDIVPTELAAHSEHAET